MIRGIYDRYIIVAFKELDVAFINSKCINTDVYVVSTCV